MYNNEKVFHSVAHINLTNVNNKNRVWFTTQYSQWSKSIVQNVTTSCRIYQSIKLNKVIANVWMKPINCSLYTICEFVQRDLQNDSKILLVIL